MPNGEYTVHNKMQQWQKTYPHWFSIISLLGFLLIWEAICRCGIISTLFLPSPSQIIAAFMDMLSNGEIAASLAASLYRILLGFVIGSLFGLVIGMLTGISSLANKIGTPILNALYPIPKIALLPLFILWLGIGELSKITIIALGVFSPWL